MAWADLSLVSTWTLAPTYVVTALVLAALVWLGRRRWRSVLVAGVVGAGVGALVSWWLGDVVDILGVSPTWVDRVWVSVVVAVLGVAVVALVQGRLLRRALAVVAVVAVVVSGGLAVNRDAGYFPTASDALGLSRISGLAAPTRGGVRNTSFIADLGRVWRPPATMPSVGRYGIVRIPGTVSRFHARPAVVYLPPAALVPNAPALPVVVMLSGQGLGASPSNVIEAGRMITRMNDVARRHRGLAPILVIPDQLRVPVNNPMCVDGKLGNSATYLTVDVPRWVRAHLHVQTSPRAWAISGFSQGGTCAIQLGAGYPGVYGSLIDVSGQLGPILTSVPETIKYGFAGNAAAYRAAQPVAVMARHGVYRHTAAFFVAGQFDSRYGPAMTVMSAAAERAGMRVTRYIVPASGHDWATAGQGLEAGVEWLMPLVGLAP